MIKKHEKCAVKNESLMMNYRSYRRVCRIFIVDFHRRRKKEHGKRLLQQTIDDDHFRDKIKKMCVSVMQLQIKDE